MPDLPLTSLRIFISHSHKDNEFGLKLTQDLRRVIGNDEAVWYDQRGLHGGDDWWSKIVENLEHCNVFMVILSPDSMESAWVKREINMAWMLLNDHRLFIPILYKTCKVRADLRMLQFIDFLPPKLYKTAFKELQDTLGQFADNLQKHIPVHQIPAPENPKGESQVKPSAPRANTVPGLAATTNGNQSSQAERRLLQQLEEAYKNEDWAAVNQKAEALLKQYSAAGSYEVYRKQCIALCNQGKWKDAQRALNLARKGASKDQQLALLLDYKNACFVQEQWDRVRTCAEEALKLLPANPEWLKTQKDVLLKLCKIRLEQGDRHYESGNYDEAIRAYTEALAHYPEHANAYFKRASAFLKKHDSSSVIKDCSEALKLNTQHVYAYVLRGAAYYKNNDLSKAIKDCDEAIKYNPRLMDAYHVRGLAYIKRKEFAQAIQDLSYVNQLAPDCVPGYYNRAYAHLVSGDLNTALYFCNEAIKRDTQCAEPFHVRGSLYTRAEQYIYALQDLNYALSLTPNHATSYYNRGEAYRKLGKYEPAIRDMYCALELNDDAAYTYWWSQGEAQEDARRAFEEYKRMLDRQLIYALSCEAAAAIYHFYKHYDKVIECLDRALSSSAASTLGYWLRADAHLQLGHLVPAINDCNLSLALEKNNAIAYRIRGEALLLQDKYTEAVEDCSKALALSSDSLELKCGTIQLNSAYAAAYRVRGQAYYKLNQFDLAVQDLSRAIKVRSGYAQAYHQRGHALRQQNNFKQAIHDFSKAIEFYKEDRREAASAYNARGECYQTLKDRQHAIEDFSKALELNPNLIVAQENMKKSYEQAS